MGLAMALIKYKLGELIELTTEINENNLFCAEDVKDMTNNKTNYSNQS